MKKVISYSLFGEKPKYLNGAIQNAILSRNLFPEWEILFYVWENYKYSNLSRVLEICQKLNPNIIIKNINIDSDHRLRILNPKMLRYLVHDEDYDFYLVRDIDSLLTLRLRKIVDWVLEKGYKFGCCMDRMNQPHFDLISSLIFGKCHYQFDMLKIIEKFYSESSYYHFIKDYYKIPNVEDLSEELIVLAHKEHLNIDSRLFEDISSKKTTIHLFYVDEVFLRWLLLDYRINEYTLVTNNIEAINKAKKYNLNYQTFDIDFLPGEDNIDAPIFYEEFSLY